ncbi:MAG: T9SS type A sorting domain-containing protein [Paludibacter sp.]
MKKIFSFLILGTLLAIAANVQAAFTPTAGVNYYLIQRSSGKAIGVNSGGYPALTFMAPESTQYFNFVAATDSAFYIKTSSGKYLTRGTANTWDIVYTDTAFVTNGYSKWYVYGSDSLNIRFRRYADQKFISPNVNYADQGDGYRFYSDKGISNGAAALPSTTFQIRTVADKIAVIPFNFFDGTFEKAAIDGGPWGTWIPKKISANVPPIGILGTYTTTSRVNNGNSYQSNGAQAFAMRFSNDTVSYVSISHKLFNLIPGATYTYSFNYKNVASSLLKVNVYAASVANDLKANAIGTVFTTDSTVTGTASTLTGSITFQAPYTSCYIVYRKANTQNNQLFVDDIALVKTVDAPEGVYVSESLFLLDDFKSTAPLTVIGTSLTQNIQITAPAGITVTPNEITAAAYTSTVVNVSFTGAATAGYINVTSGGVSKRVRVIAKKNADCLTQVYPTLTNIITDPYLTSLSYFGGWGTKALINDTINTAYCGFSCVTVGNGVTKGGGSLDFNATGKMQANTKYRIHAMIKTIGGTYEFGIGGCGVGGSTSDFNTLFNTNGEWQAADFTFKTGTLAASQGIYFNSSLTADGLLGYIDNYEMYAVPAVYPSSASLTFLGNGTKKVAVRAVNLASNITITAPSGYSVTPSTLLPTVSGGTSDSIAITFSSATSASGYVYFTSGTVKDSLQVTGTMAPSILTSKANLYLDDLNLTDSVVVNGGNLASDITITAPSGFTVTPTTIPMASASNVKMKVTYDGTTSNATGNIVLTSGTLVVNVGVAGSKNSECFTPLYSNLTNLIPSPQLNTLTGFAGWGHKDIVSGEAYCGAKCVKFTAVTNGWPEGAALDVNAIPWTAGHKYRVRVMVKTVDGTLGMLAKGTSPDFMMSIPQSGTNWITIDTTFTAGAGAAANFFTINNVDAAATGKIAYIDNYELYDLGLGTGVKTIGIEATKVYTTSNSIVANFELQTAGVVEFNIYNIQGMLVAKNKSSFDAGMNQKVMNVNIPSGVYLINVINDGKQATFKVVK